MTMAEQITHGARSLEDFIDVADGSTDDIEQDWDAGTTTWIFWDGSRIIAHEGQWSCDEQGVAS